MTAASCQTEIFLTWTSFGFQKAVFQMWTCQNTQKKNYDATVVMTNEINEAIQVNQLINIDHRDLINVNMVPSNPPVTPLRLLRGAAADTLSTFGDIFIDPRSDLWLNGPLVFITEEDGEQNICTNEGFGLEKSA